VGPGRRRHRGARGQQHGAVGLVGQRGRGDPVGVVGAVDQVDRPGATGLLSDAHRGGVPVLATEPLDRVTGDQGIELIPGGLRQGASWSAASRPPARASAKVADVATTTALA
jgi:hypothetical protein